MHRVAAIPTTGFSRPRGRCVDILHSYNQLVDFTHHPAIVQTTRLSLAHRRGFGLLTSAFINNHSTGDKWRETQVDMEKYLLDSQRVTFTLLGTISNI